MSRSVQESYQADRTVCNLSARDCRDALPVKIHILNSLCRNLGVSHLKRGCVPCAGILRDETGFFTGAIGIITSLITHRDVISRLKNAN